MKDYPYYYSTVSIKDMSGPKKVVVFCFLMGLLPALLIILPLYLRSAVFADVVYAVSEADILEVHKGLSTVFCEAHSLNMNTSFNAFQVDPRTEVKKSLKHMQMTKSMLLKDDTLEYWRFYLLKGATVKLKACSRYEGSNLLLVKGEKALDFCGMLNNEQVLKVQPILATGHDKVSVAFELDFPMPSNQFEEAPNQYRVSGNRLSKTQKSTAIPESGEEEGLNSEENLMENSTVWMRGRRDTDKQMVTGKEQEPRDPHHILDRMVNHGGNAMNPAAATDEEDVSSFENGLLECFDKRILLNQEFPASVACKDSSALHAETHPHSNMITYHEVIEDGYYFYIFYSDNDLLDNEIHAMFDVYKPSFNYLNLTDEKVCVNQTSCRFSVAMWSEETVVVEVPTGNRDRNSLDPNGVFLLTSTCHPRMSVYIIFPIAVLFIILTCAFL